MTDLTLKNYASKLSKDLLLLAKKNKVRECDEAKKGQFVAYVDEGKDSYDVELVFGAGGKVTGHTCDCVNGTTFCRHKSALLMHLAAGGKIAEKVKAKKKESKTETLLNAAGADELREWVRGLVTKNKDIELSFVHHFSVKEQPTPADVIKITNDAIKAVAGNKKNIDPTQLKKLVELWSEMHAPMILHYQVNPTDEKSFLNFHTMLETCLDFDLKTPTTSNKIAKFVETTLQSSQECIGNLYNEEAWATSVNFILQKVPDGVNQVRMHYLLHLKNIMDLGSADRKLRMIDWLAKQFGKSTPPDRMYNGTAYQKFIFDMVVNQVLFPQYYRLFNPIRFDNDYNEELISLLIESDHLKVAKGFCEAQIEGNYKEEYNVPYYKSLKQIFVIQNDKANLAKVLTVLFPYTFDFDDYLLISGTMGEEERKKWRTKMFARARNSSYCRTNQAMEFCFKLARHENQPRKMIEAIQSYTPYQLILTYFEPMVQGDKTRLLETLIRKSDDSWYGASTRAEQDACFPELYALAVKHYTAPYLRAVINEAAKSKYSYYNSLNRLIIYMKERLV